MAKTKNLTKKEITEDQIRLLLVETWEQVVEYRRYILAVILAAILSGIGYWSFEGIQASRALQAQEKLSEALRILTVTLPNPDDQTESNENLPYTNEEQKDEEALNKFQQLAREHGWSEVGELAHFYVGVTQQKLKKYQEALNSFREIANHPSNLELQHLARNHVALLCLYLDCSEEAIKSWNLILDEPSSHMPTSEIMSSLAKTYDSAGKKTKALDLFKQLLSEHPSLANSASIEARVELLQGDEMTEKEPHSTLKQNEKGSNNETNE